MDLEELMTRTTTTTLALGLALLTTACGGDYEGGEGNVAATDFSGFCEEVLPRVDAFIARMEQEHPVTDSARHGGTAVVGIIGELTLGMNTFVATNYETNEHSRHLNSMTLLRWNDDFELAPWLAESWEVDDVDHPTQVTFHLRPDVYWHDGVKVDAQDVAFTYVTITNPETAYANLSSFDHYVHGPEGVEVVDSLTVRIRIARPHAEYLDPWPFFVVMPRHLLEGVPVTELRQHPFGEQCPVGNGPFVFVEHRPQESWTFRANPAFPEGLGGRPFLDRYVVRVIPEQTTLLTDLLTENIDVYINPRPDQAGQIEASPNLRLLTFKWPAYTLVAWNARKPMFADARVRRALTMATNRREIVQSQLRGYGSPATTGVHPLHFAHDSRFGDSLAYDPEAARRLLDQAGWQDRDGDGVRENADGVRFEFTLKYNQGNQRRADIAEIMQAQLAEVGVRVQPQVLEFGTMIAQMTSPERDFDAAVFGWNMGFGRLDEAAFFHSAKIDEPYAFSGTKSPRLDHLLDTLQLIVDREDARPFWREYQAAIVQEQPYTFIYFDDRLEGINRRLQGVRMDARGEWINVHEWWIAPEDRGGRRVAGR
jgi:peptide/nickel transport system substrate-binding protein